MFKVFLVDDEELVIKSLKASVNWNEYGFEVVGYALSGAEAFEVITQIKPDVVFTDIRMPGMSGLELIKNLKDSFNSALSIVVSGYAEFAFAQKAINYGAFGYCLKPFDDDEIIGYLKKARVVLENRQKPIETKHEQLSSHVRNRTFNSIYKHINENYRNDISLHSISKQFNVNANYISQLFKKEAGTTFTEHLTKLRIEYACTLMKTTDLPLNEIADKAGYGDYFYFCRIFKKMMGETASSYRAGLERGLLR